MSNVELSKGSESTRFSFSRSSQDTRPPSELLIQSNSRVFDDGLGAFIDEPSREWQRTRNVELASGQRVPLTISLDGANAIGEVNSFDLYIGGLDKRYHLTRFHGQEVDSRSEALRVANMGDMTFLIPLVEQFRHPEGLTSEQQKLAGMFFDNKVNVNVKKRREVNSTYEFYEEKRELPILAFAQDDEEFVKTSHEKSPGEPLTPYYFSMRQLPVDVRRQCGIVLAEMKGDKTDVVTGIPNAGVDLARAYSEISGVPYKDVFFKTGQLGNAKLILPRDDARGDGISLTIIDDLVDEAITKGKAADSAKRLGYNVAEMRVLVDRQRRREPHEGFVINAAMTIDQILKYGVRTGRATEEQYQKATDFNRS